VVPFARSGPAPEPDQRRFGTIPSAGGQEGAGTKDSGTGDVWGFGGVQVTRVAGVCPCGGVAGDGARARGRAAEADDRPPTPAATATATRHDDRPPIERVAAGAGNRGAVRVRRRDTHVCRHRLACKVFGAGAERPMAQTRRTEPRTDSSGPYRPGPPGTPLRRRRSTRMQSGCRSTPAALTRRGLVGVLGRGDVTASRQTVARPRLLARRSRARRTRR